MTVSSKDSFTDYFSGGSESFKGTAQSVSQTFLTGRILEFTTDRWPLQLSIQFAWSSFQARVQALKKIFPDYEDNAPTMSESAFNRMTYPRWVGKKKINLIQLLGRYLNRPVQFPPALQVLREGVGLAVLGQGADIGVHCLETKFQF